MTSTAAHAPRGRRSVDEIIVAHGAAGPEALIPLLQELQEELGYLSAPTMVAVARALGLPPSRVYGVATFYNQFRFAPLGRHVVEVCRGTACHVKESLALDRHLVRRLKVRPNGNSPDGEFTLVRVACLGACSIAPVIRLDGEFHGHLTVEHLDRLLETIAAGEAAAAAPPAARPAELRAAP